MNKAAETSMKNCRRKRRQDFIQIQIKTSGEAVLLTATVHLRRQSLVPARHAAVLSFQ